MTDERASRAERLAELVSLLTGADALDAAAATCGQGPKPGGLDSLEIVARAIVDLRDSHRSLRVTPYLGHNFEPVIDLRTGRIEDDDDHEGGLTTANLRFRRHGRDAGGTPRRVGGRPAGTSPPGFVPA